MQSRGSAEWCVTSGMLSVREAVAAVDTECGTVARCLHTAVLKQDGSRNSCLYDFACTLAS
jgi:hypothetical protein